MRLSAEQARERFAGARVARLATVDGTGAPHLVPITFAAVHDAILFAVDHKPKSTTELRRLHNIAVNPMVSVLADHYDEDWTALWWARADGLASVLGPAPEHPESLRALCAKYRHYDRRPPEGPLVRIEVSRWSGWSASE